MGGLWHQMGEGALGVGFGGASGLWFGSCGIFEEAKLILQYDEELMAKESGSGVVEAGDGSA